MFLRLRGRSTRQGAAPTQRPAERERERERENTLPMVRLKKPGRARAPVCVCACVLLRREKTSGVIMSVSGRSFYLHEVPPTQARSLCDIISRMGGTVESFFTKEVDVILTRPAAAPSRPEDHHTPLRDSRGKDLLQRVMNISTEKLVVGVLTSARCWGVQIVPVHRFLRFLHHLDWRQAGSAGGVVSHQLRPRFLKVEDTRRSSRPFFTQAVAFPLLSFSGRWSPFEELVVCVKREERLSQEKKKKKKSGSGFCECCHVSYRCHRQHLQSECHQRFVGDERNYAAVERVCVGLLAGVGSVGGEGISDRFLQSFVSVSTEEDLEIFPTLPITFHWSPDGTGSSTPPEELCALTAPGAGARGEAESVSSVSEAPGSQELHSRCFKRRRVDPQPPRLLPFFLEEPQRERHPDPPHLLCEGSDWDSGL